MVNPLQRAVFGGRSFGKPDFTVSLRPVLAPLMIIDEAATVGEICHHIGVSEQSYYRWRREYGGLEVDQARRLKDLEQENTRLKRAVADLTLDKLILKEAAEGNW